jgi:hypothetical protein
LAREIRIEEKDERLWWVNKICKSLEAKGKALNAKNIRKKQTGNKTSKNERICSLD